MPRYIVTINPTCYKACNKDITLITRVLAGICKKYELNIKDFSTLEIDSENSISKRYIKEFKREGIEIITLQETLQNKNQEA